MYSDTHNIADLTNEELYRMRDYGKFEYDREAAAAELARREQAAQPEAQPTNDDLMRSNSELARLLDAAHDNWNVVYAESQRRGERIIELERDNERLRGLLASLIDELIISELTEEDAARIEPLIGDAQAAIKAAKEASNAN